MSPRLRVRDACTKTWRGHRTNKSEIEKRAGDGNKERKKTTSAAFSEGLSKPGVYPLRHSVVSWL